MSDLADLVVSLRADFGDVTKQVSDLQDDLKDLANATVEVGDQMNLFGGAMDALSTPLAEASGQMNLFATEMEQVGDVSAESAGGMEDAAEATRSWEDTLSDLVDKLTETGDSEEHAAEEAHSFVSEMMAFAGIALTLEGLKEMAVETFEAFAKEERSTEALTALMHSSKDAENAIEELRGTSLKLAVANETLRDTFQQMVARGFEIEKITPMLTSVANASRAMNTSFESIANMTERMIQSGTLNTRMLTRLGISIDDVAKVMNTTAADAPKMFKALDQSERMDVVSSSLDKFKGLAVTTSTDLTGSWTNLKNVAEQTFEDIGKQLAPLGQEFMKWAQETIREIKPMVENVIAFGREIGHLPSIVKEALGMITIAFAANPAAAAALSILQLALATSGYREATKGAADQEKQREASVKSLLITQSQLFAEYPAFKNQLKSLADEWESGKKSDEQFTLGMLNLAKAFREVNPAAEEAAKATKKAHQAPYEEQKAALDAETKHNEAMLALDRAAYEAQAQLDGTSIGDQLSHLRAYNQLTYDIKANSIAKELALEKSSKAEQKNLALSGDLQAAKDKLAAENQKLQEKVTAEQKKEIDKQIHDELAADEHKEASVAQLVANVGKLLDQEDADYAKSLQEQVKGQLAHDTAILETQRAVGAAEVSAHQMTVFDKAALDKSIDDDEIARDKTALAQEIANLEARRTAFKSYAAEIQALRNQMQSKEDQTSKRDAVLAVQQETEAWKVLGAESSAALATQISEIDQAMSKLREEGAPLAVLSAGEQKRLEMEIKLREQQGQDASAQIIALQNEKMLTDALAISTHGFADIYVGLTNEFKTSFTTLGNALTQAAMQTKHLGAAMVEAGKEIASSIVNTVIQGALNQLYAVLVKQLVQWGILKTGITAGNAAILASNKALLTSYTAVGAAGATAFASIATAALAAAEATYFAIAAMNLSAVISYEGVADAAATAAYAGIPFTGPGLAAAAIALMAPFFATYEGMAMAETGGTVMETGMAVIHQGEEIMTKQGRGTVEQLLTSGAETGGGANAGGGPYFDFRGAVFGTGLTQGAVNTMMDGAFSRLRLAGMKPALT